MEKNIFKKEKKKKMWLKKYPEEGPVWSGPESCGPSSNFKFKLK